MSAGKAAAVIAVPLLGVAACGAVLLAGGAGQGAAPLAGACTVPGPAIVQAAATTPATVGPAGSTATASAALSRTGQIPEKIGVWTRPQLVNAGHVIRAGHALGLDAWTITVGVMTTMGESHLRVLGHGDTAGPDSRGLWQQRDNGAWGTLADRMDPTVSSTNAFKALIAVPGYHDLPPTIAAHRLQRNSDPYYYAPFWPDAVTVVAALTADPALATSLPAGAEGTTCAGVVDPIGAPAVSGRWANPLRPAKYTLTSAFGQYRPFLPTSKLHKGQDLAAPIGTPVLAVCDAVVVSAGWDTYGGGNMTTIDCGAGVTVKLMHQSALLTRAGATVRAGQKIGLVGTTGNSTGPHLHEQVEIRGVPVDPIPFMRARGVPL